MDFCCDELRNAVEGVDNIITWSSPDKKYQIDAFDIVENYLISFCPFCGAKLIGDEDNSPQPKA